MLDKELEDQILKQSLMIAIIDEKGKVIWITTGEPTLKQIRQFQRIQIITENPSYILQAIFFIELTILRLVNSIQIILKGKDE